MDAQLAKDLQRETEALADRRAFGLNFERHVPEVVELPGRSVRKYDNVHVLPVRGQNPTKENERLYRVTDIVEEGQELWANVAAVDNPAEERPFRVDDLIVVAEFRDAIYPGLVSTGKVERGGDKPFHTVINAENYHALQALLFTHRGKVDVIYIDPPYNTGNAEWIYNDKYVDNNDHYSHSKWLAFMERRLIHARDLLKSEGVIFISIDAHEHARLEMLCDSIFGETNKLTSFVWEKTAHFGRQKQNFYANCEYVVAYARKLGTDSGARRELLIENVKTEFEDAPLYNASNPVNSLTFPPGIVSFRIPDGTYTQSTDTKYELLAPVHVSEGVNTNALKLRFRSRWSQANTDEQTAKGTTFLVKSTKFAIRAEYADGKSSYESPRQTIYTNPNNPSRSVSRFGRKVGTTDEGSAELKDILGEKPAFSYPKPVSLIEYLLSLFADVDRGDEAHPDDIVVLDYFVGTGTTAEAVMRLNAIDGGNRRSIVVTNNELSVETATALRKRGFQPGDPEWESEGIFQKVTKPRLMTVASGSRDNGSTYSDGLDENVEFFTLTYESAMRVSSGREFARIAPFLWMRAGSKGRRIDDISRGWDVADAYGVIANLDQSGPFITAIDAQEGLTCAFIVTDEDRLFEAMVRQLPEHVEPVRLYSSYLRNFEIEAGRAAR